MLSTRKRPPAPAPTAALRDSAQTPRVVEAATTAFLAAYGDRPAADIALVVPAYNEQGAVGDVVANAPRRLGGLSVETIVVDDGSGDATSDEAEAAGAMVCRLASNVGQGVALRVGYRLASARGARYIATTDADGQFDAAELEGLLVPVLAGTADFANGSRRLGRSHTTDPVRAAGVVLFGHLISVLTGVTITDPANGLRLWRREVTDTVSLRQPQYQTSELLIRAIANGFRVVEVPVTVYVREQGETKKGRNLRYGARFCRVIVTTWWSERQTARRTLRRPRGLWR